MEAKKKKDFQNYPRITYSASNRKFERLLRESSLESIKNVVRQKLHLSDTAIVELTQRRNGDLLDLEDDDDFAALRSFAYSNGSVDVVINYDTSVNASGTSHAPGMNSNTEVIEEQALPKYKRKNEVTGDRDGQEQGVRPAKKKKLEASEKIKQYDTSNTKEISKPSMIGSSKESECNEPSLKRKRSKSGGLELKGSANVSTAAVLDAVRSKSVAPGSFKLSESSASSSKRRSKSVAPDSEMIVTTNASIPPKLKNKRSKSIGRESTGEARKRPPKIINENDGVSVSENSIFDKWMSSKNKGKISQTSIASEVEDHLVAGPSKISISQAPDAGEVSDIVVDVISKKKKKKQVDVLAQVESPDVAGRVTVEIPSRNRKKGKDKMLDSLTTSNNQHHLPDQDSSVQLESGTPPDPSYSVEPVMINAFLADEGFDVSNRSGDIPTRRKKKKKKNVGNSIANNNENTSGLVLEETPNEESNPPEDTLDTAELSSTLVDGDERPKKKRKNLIDDSISKASTVEALPTSTAETSPEGILPTSSRVEDTTSSAVEKSAFTSLKLDPSEILSQYYQKKSISKRSSTTKSKRRQILTKDSLSENSTKDDCGLPIIVSGSQFASSSSIHGSVAPKCLPPVTSDNEIIRDGFSVTKPVERVPSTISNLEPDFNEDDSSSVKSDESSDEEAGFKQVVNMEVSNIDYNQLTEAEKILLEIQKSTKLRTANILASMEEEEANQKGDDIEEDNASFEEEEEEEHERSGQRLLDNLPITSYGERAAFLQDDSSSEEEFPMNNDSLPSEQTPPPGSSPGKEAGLPLSSPVLTEASTHSQILLFKDVNDRGESILDSHRGDDAVDEAMEEDNAVIKTALEELEQEYERDNAQKRKSTPSESDDITRVSDSDRFDLGKEGPVEMISSTVAQSDEITVPQIGSHIVTEPTGVADILNSPTQNSESNSHIDQHSNAPDIEKNSRVSSENDATSRENCPNWDLPQSNHESGQLGESPLLPNVQAELVNPVPTTPSRISSAGMIRRMKDRFGHSPWKSGGSLSDQDSNFNDPHTTEIKSSVTPTPAHTAEEPSDLQPEATPSPPSKALNPPTRVTRASARRSLSVTNADAADIVGTGSQVQEKPTRKPSATRSRKKAAASTERQDEQSQSQSQSLRRSGRLREKPVVLIPEHLFEPGNEHQSSLNDDVTNLQAVSKVHSDVHKVTLDSVKTRPNKTFSENFDGTNQNNDVDDISKAVSQEKDTISTQAVSALFPSQIPSSFILRPAHPVAGSASVAEPSAPLQNHSREPSPTESSSSEDEAQKMDVIARPSINPMQMSQSQSQFSYPFFQTLTDLSKRSDLFLSTKSSSPTLKSAPINSLKKKNLRNDEDYDEFESSSSSSDDDDDTKKVSIIPPERRAGNKITTSTPRTPSRKFSLSFISTK